MMDCVAVLRSLLCGHHVRYMTCMTAIEKVFFSRHIFFFLFGRDIDACLALS